MKINWRVRFKNPQWVAGFVAQMLIIAQMVTAGLNSAGAIDFVWTQEIDIWVLGFVNAVLVVFAMIGVVADPTTKTINDSPQAQRYDEPK